MPQTTDQLTETVRKALHRAYNLGQTYWQQADSESYAANKRSEETAAKFDQLSAETLAALSAVPLVAEAPMEPVACEHLRCTWAGPGTPLVCDSCHVTLGYKIASVPPASLAPMPEPTDEQIKQIWLSCKSVSNEAFCIEFARAVLASVAPQPEQPNTEQPHLADNGRKPVQGLDAAAGVALPAEGQQR